jgi:hypothetical protein
MKRENEVERAMKRKNLTSDESMDRQIWRGATENHWAVDQWETDIFFRNYILKTLITLLHYCEKENIFIFQHGHVDLTYVVTQ